MTVVFADLVGSTSLQERLDTESVRRVMTRFYDTARAIIEAHEGQVVKFVGDGVMAAFGHAGRARGRRAARGARGRMRSSARLDRAERASSSATGACSLRLRTGVNTGEVVVGGEDGDLIGDPVNVAARLEQAAADGEVLVGADTSGWCATT